MNADGAPGSVGAHSLEGRVALVTGGTGLVGRVVVARLRARGAATVSLSRSGAPVDGAQLALAADVGDEAALDAAIGRIEVDLGPVDILVHAVHPTLARRSRVAELTARDLTVQLDAVADYVAVVRRVVPGMRERGYGRVVYVSGALMARPALGNGAYGAAKSAASVITRYLALEEGRSGVTANIVAPSRVLDPDRPDPTTPELVELAAALRARMALPDWPRPDDVAAAIVGLVESPAITGQTLWITGGETIA